MILARGKLSRRRDRALLAARALGLDEKLEAREGDRVVRVTIQETTDGDAISVLRLALRASLADAPSIRIRGLTLGRSFAVALGFVHPVAVQDPELEKAALVEARDPLRARTALAAGLAEAARALLHEFPEAELVSTGDALTISVEEREGAIVTLLELAGRAAQALETARIKAVSREAVVRCGFCHGDLVPEERDVRCDRCGATVHATCWEAHKGCPALGCKGHAR